MCCFVIAVYILSGFSGDGVLILPLIWARQISVIPPVNWLRFVHMRNLERWSGMYRCVHNAAAIATDEWWAAVGRTRLANDDHMGEEEREGLADFRRHASIGLREALGRQYREFMAQHPTTKGLSIVDRDPESYVEEQEGAARSPRKDFSLGIGSLKGE